MQALNKYIAMSYYHLSRLLYRTNMQMNYNSGLREMQALWCRKYTICQPTITPQGSTVNRVLKDDKLFSPQVRMFYSTFKKPKTPEYYRTSDNIDSHYDLVYLSDTTNYVRSALGGLQVAGVTGLAVLSAGILNLPFIDLSIIENEPVQAGIFVGLNLLICFSVFRAIIKHPIRMYYSDLEDKFVFIFVGVHPFAIRTLEVQPGEVVPVSPSKLTEVVLPWASNIYAVPSQKIYMNNIHFKYPVYYNKLLGYE